MSRKLRPRRLRPRKLRPLEFFLKIYIVNSSQCCHLKCFTVTQCLWAVTAAYERIEVRGPRFEFSWQPKRIVIFTWVFGVWGLRSEVWGLRSKISGSEFSWHPDNFTSKQTFKILYGLVQNWYGVKVLTSDGKWPRLTTNDHEWPRVTTNDHGWPWVGLQQKLSVTLLWRNYERKSKRNRRRTKGERGPKRPWFLDWWLTILAAVASTWPPP